MNRFVLGLTLMLALAPRPALAQLVVDRLIVDFEHGAANRQDILLRNESEDKYYVTISPAEILNAGETNTAKVTKTNPDDLGLLVTPNRVVLDPGASRSIRLVSLNGPLTQDRIYRVLIAPQVGELKPETSTPGTKAVAIKILTAYEALVVARPDNAQPKIIAQRTDGGLVLKNAGNSNTLLYDGQACEAKAADGAKPKCAKIEPHRLYVGNAWQVPLPHPTDVATFHMRMTSAHDPQTVHF